MFTRKFVHIICAFLTVIVTPCFSQAAQNGLKKEEIYHLVSVKIDGRAFVFRAGDGVDPLKTLDSSVINKLAEPASWRVQAVYEQGDEKRTVFEKTITLPFSIEPLVFEKIRALASELLSIPCCCLPEHSEPAVVQKLLNQAYERRNLVAIVRMLKALELLECNKLVEMMHKELEDLGKKDAQFLACWQAAVDRFQAQALPMPVAGSAVAKSSSIICTKVAQLKGDTARWFNQKNMLTIMRKKTGSTYRAQFYNTVTKQLSRVFDGAVCSVAPDGTKSLIFCGDTGSGKAQSIKMFDLQTDKELQAFTGFDAQFMGNGETIFVRSPTPDALEIRQTCDGKLITPEQMPHAFYATFSPDGTKMLTSATCTYSAVYDFVQGKTLFTCLGGNGIFSPDSSKIAVQSREGSLHVTTVYDVQSGHQLDEFCEEAAAAFSHDGQRLGTVVRDAKTGCKTIIHDLASGRIVGTVPGDLQQFMPGDSSKAIVFNEQSQKLVFYDFETNHSLSEFEGTSWAEFSADGSHLVMQKGNEATVYKLVRAS